MKIGSSLLLCLLTFGSVAQETKAPRITEYHFVVGAPLSLNDLTIGFDLKRQIGERMFFKASVLSLGFDQNSETVNQNGYDLEKNTIGYSGGLGAGIEFRYPLNKRLTFFHGPNIAGSYGYSQSKVSLLSNSSTSKSWVFSAGIPYTLGFMVELKHNIFLSAFVSPSASYYMGETTDQNNAEVTRESGIRFRLNDQVSGISVAIRR